MSNYPQGWPSWVDLQTGDVDAAARFYAGLFGWQMTVAGHDGAYRMFQLRGRNVAGVSSVPVGVAPVWSSYISVDDADATMQRARQRGAITVIDPVVIGGAGRMAIFRSPDGAPVGIWQAGTHGGAQLCNEPGTFCWNELNTQDAEAAIDFYPRVFDWTVSRSKGAVEYYEFQVIGHPVAGMQPMLGARWQGLASHWVVYFAVADADEAMVAVGQLGGSVEVDVTPIPGVGRFSVVRDPQGAQFCLLEVTTPR